LIANPLFVNAIQHLSFVVEGHSLVSVHSAPDIESFLELLFVLDITGVLNLVGGPFNITCRDDGTCSVLGN